MIPPVQEVSVGRLSQIVRDHASARVSDALTLLESAVRLQVEVKQFESKHNEAMEYGHKYGLKEGMDLVHVNFVEPVMDQITMLSVKELNPAQKWEQLVSFIRSQCEVVNDRIHEKL